MSLVGHACGKTAGVFSISAAEARAVAKSIGADLGKISLEQLRRGIEVEMEHSGVDKQTNVIDMDLSKAGKIAWAHLKEMPDYYTRLDKMEGQAKKASLVKAAGAANLALAAGGSMVGAAGGKLLAAKHTKRRQDETADEFVTRLNRNMRRASVAGGVLGIPVGVALAVGADRLVSSLVKSAAAEVVGRLRSTAAYDPQYGLKNKKQQLLDADMQDWQRSPDGRNFASAPTQAGTVSMKRDWKLKQTGIRRDRASVSQIATGAVQ